MLKSQPTLTQGTVQLLYCNDSPFGSCRIWQSLTQGMHRITLVPIAIMHLTRASSYYSKQNLIQNNATHQIRSTLGEPSVLWFANLYPSFCTREAQDCFQTQHELDPDQFVFRIWTSKHILEGLVGVLAPFVLPCECLHKTPLVMPVVLALWAMIAISAGLE